MRRASPELGQFNRLLLDRLDALQHARLDPERMADLDIIRDAVSLKLLELDRIQDFRHNPTLYVELIGNGMYTPFVLNYAPPEVRFQDLIGRLRGLPALVAQAKANLLDAPEVWNRVAREENEGNIELIDKTLREQAPASLRAAYAEAAAPALQSLRDFNDYLATTLAAKTSDWRIGKANYDRKCRYTLHTGRTPAQLLAAAEADLAATRAEMARLAAPRTVAVALQEMASQHATPATYMDEARRTLSRSHGVREAEGPAHATRQQQSRGHRYAGFHARCLRGRWLQSGAGARAAARRVLLGDADTERLAGGARRIQAA